MRLVYYLEQLKASTLKKMLNKHGIKTNEKYPNKLLNHLLVRLLDINYLKQLYQELSLEEKEVVDFMIIHRPNQLFSYRSLNKRFDAIHRDQFERGIQKLRAKGILFQLRQNYGDIAFTIPHDLFQLLHQVIFAKGLNRLSTNVKVVGFSKEEDKNIDEEFYQFLTGLYFLASSEEENGKLNKQQMNKLLKRLHLDERKIEYFPIQYDIEEFPKSISLFVYFAKGLGLIHLEQKQFRIIQRMKDWLLLSPFERYEYLEGMIRGSFQSTDLFINHFFHRLFSLPKGKWYQADQLVQELSKELNRPIDESFYVRIELEILKPLAELGILTYTGDWKKELFIKLKKPNDEEIDQFYVQSNFEVLVPSNLRYSIRIELEHFADLEKRDQLSLYRITQGSLFRGLEKGKKIEQILDFLDQYSAIPLHESMKITINQWANRYGAIQFYDLRILKCQSEEIANHLKQQEVLQDWIIGEIDSFHLIVRKEKRFEQAVRQLEQLGYIPTRNIMTEKDFLIVKEEQEGQENVLEEMETEFILFKHPDYELVVEIE
ncbi:helicase-associated domain-containing protein [Tepidibacillus fermentans]|uniref:XPB/Ssl2-like helicase family protein n=1 Tax=Tepidibacillus fermentans TaxID=1281767 RepID=A0A4R3K623_9BACI|nr:helicase-associated domain-containing protein [Tepidibacillus fermentans]TCS78239.1 XPB/Ssl2-like helicase family protein [Tepidibacillus fermentans]